MLGVRLPQPAAKVGLQVVRDATPGFQQFLVDVDAALDVGLARPEEGLHRLRGEVLGVLIIVIAEGVDIITPEVRNELTHGLSRLEGIAVDLDEIGQDIDGVGRRRQHTNPLLRRQSETVRGRTGQVHARVGLLEGLRQHASLGDIPVLPFPFKLVRRPDLGQHRDGLLPEAARVSGIYAQTRLLIGIGATRAQFDAPIGELVEQGDALGNSTG